MLTKIDHVHDDARLASALGTQAFVALRQVHGARTIAVDAPAQRNEEADGLVTDSVGLTLTIRSADCQTFLVFDPVTTSIGVLHVGWRGLLCGAIAAHMKVLKDACGVRPETALVCAGPSLCTACATFTDPATELTGIDPHFFHGRCADLRGIADAQWAAQGIVASKMERMSACTRCNPAEYWTYRGGDREQVIGGYTNVLAVRMR